MKKIAVWSVLGLFLVVASGWVIPPVADLLMGENITGDGYDVPIDVNTNVVATRSYVDNSVANVTITESQIVDFDSSNYTLSTEIYANFLRMLAEDGSAGGDSNTVISVGREPGMFIKYAGNNVYTHDFSSVRYVIGPSKQEGETWTNVPSEKMHFRVLENQAVSPIRITLTNKFDGVTFTNQRDKAYVYIDFEANPDYQTGINVGAAGVTNERVINLMLEPGRNVSLAHATNENESAVTFDFGMDVIAGESTNQQVSTLRFIDGFNMTVNQSVLANESIVQYNFDGEIINLVYRGFYDPDILYGPNQLVVVENFLGALGDPRIPGENLFLNAYVTKDDPPDGFPFFNKTPSADSAYWQPFVTQGPPGATGVGNAIFDSTPWQLAFQYGSNTVVSFEDNLYLSLVDIDPQVDTNAFITNPSFWRRIVRRGEDGAPGQNITREFFYIYTNQVVQGLTFIGDFEVSPRRPSYNSNDVVTFRGAAYFTPVSIPSDPPEPPNEPWEVFAARGESGVSGVVLTDLTFVSPIQYSTSTFYPSNSVVRFEGSLWYAKIDVNQPTFLLRPPLNPFDSVVNTSNNEWELLVPRGAKGADGGIGIDGVFRQNFSLFAQGGYSVNDLVYHDGGLWRAILPQPSGSVQFPSATSTGWELLIRSGVDGKTGAALAYYGRWTNTGSNGGVPNVWTTNDVVSYTPSGQRGGLWVCIQNHTGDQEPQSGSQYWELAVADGLDAQTLDFAYRGNFQTLTEYGTNDVVTYPISGVGRSLWRPNALIPATNENPPADGPWQVVLRGTQGPQGQSITGPKGDKGDKGDPGINLAFRGEWTNSITYSTNDLVRFGGTTWHPTENVPSNFPPQGSNLEFWRVFVMDGLPGDKGDKGDAGDISGFNWAGTNANWVSVSTNAGVVSASWTTTFINYLNALPDGGATNIAAGSTDSYNVSTRTLTWNTNAAGGGGISAITIATEGTGNVVTNLTAGGSVVTQFLGTVVAELPAGVLTNNQTGVTLTGTFSGDGSSLTGITAAAISESDPVFTNWLETAFSDAVTNIVGTISVTGAVTDVNGLDGSITVEGGSGIAITTNANTLTIASDNVLTPDTINATLSGEWTIDFTDGGLQLFEQSGGITNVVLAYDTNKVSYAEVLILTDGSNIQWPTNNVTWVPDPLGPPVASNQWQSVIFRAHRGNVQGAYIETYD